MTDSKANLQDRQKEREAAVQAYDKVVTDARMQDVRLVSYHFDVKPEYYLTLAPDAKKASLAFDHQFANVAYSAADKLLFGEVHWTVTAKVGRTTPLKIHAAFLISYSNVPDVGDAHSEAFMKRVGLFASYPYFRALVAQTSWESQVELPILPVLT